MGSEFRSRFVVPHGIDELPGRIRDRTIHAVERRGKFILLRLDDGVLTIHLGMTGKLLFDTARTLHTYAVLILDDGEVIYDDPRQFGKFEWSAEVPRRVARLGPEPLEIPAADFYAGVHRRKRRIKPLLLNQSFMRGLGNIYVDESLFGAGIHPRAVAAKLSKERVLRLWQSMRTTLESAISRGGSSISDYVDAEGRKGSFQDLHRVYGKEGVACPICGTPIRRTVVAQRGTHFCPRCQRY